MNILLDTNILIPFEDTTRELDPRLANLRRGVDQLGYRLYIHPAQIEDINRDRDEQRKSIVLSRIQQYNQIPSPPVLSAEERDRYGWTEGSDNDRIDNLLLHALNRGAVHILVSDDKGIHRKAARTGIHAQVYRLDQIVALVEGQRQKPFKVPYGIRERYLHEFDVQKPFFDSLRAGYGASQFNLWYANSSSQHRKCWCVASKDASDLQALCIYKQEDTPVVTDCGIQLEGKVLKLCTLKVGETIRGKKVGERLLYTAFNYAIENHVDFIYVHMNANCHEHLNSLVQDYGFQLVGKYGGDEVYAKAMKPAVSAQPLQALEYAIQHHPHFRDDEAIQKFIVPIRPSYHENLFPDISDFSTTLFGNEPSFFSPQSNTIKKAYLCHSKTTRVAEGDLLLFFRTGDRRSIEVIGVVEKAIRTQDPYLATSLVSKRTVYSQKEVSELLKKPTLIVLFRLMRYFPAIPNSRFGKIEIKEPIQTIRQISHQDFSQLMAVLPS